MYNKIIEFIIEFINRIFFFKFFILAYFIMLKRINNNMRHILNYVKFKLKWNKK